MQNQFGNAIPVALNYFVAFFFFLSSAPDDMENDIVLKNITIHDSELRSSSKSSILHVKTDSEYFDMFVCLYFLFLHMHRNDNGSGSQSVAPALAACVSPEAY